MTVVSFSSHQQGVEPPLGRRFVRLCLIVAAIAPVVLVVCWFVILTHDPGNSLTFHYWKLATFTAILSGFGLYFCRGSWRLAAFWRAFGMFLVIHTAVHIALLPYGQGWMDFLGEELGPRPRHYDWLLTCMLAEGIVLALLREHLGFSPDSPWRQTRRRR